MKRTLGAACLALLFLTTAGCKGDPKTPEYWGKAFDHAQKAKDRARVAEDLRESGNVNASFLPMLHAHLASDKSYEVKASIAKILGSLKDPSSVDPLIDALDLGNTEPAANGANKEIAAALGEIGDQKAQGQLLKLLNAKDPYVKLEAINALGKVHAAAAAPKLIDLATDENTEPFISKKAIQALGEIGDPSAIPALTKMMFKERRGVSFYAESSFALYQIGAKSEDAMLPILEGKDKELMSWASSAGLIEAALYAKAAQVEGDLHDGRAEKALLQKLAYNNEMLDVKLFVRMRAADALGRMHSKEAAKQLAGMLEEDEANTRNEYVRALVKIGEPSTLPALAKAAQKGSWDARQVTMRGLSMIGDEKTLADFQKFETTETALTAAECKEDPDYRGCDKQDALVKDHVTQIQAMEKPLQAAKECSSDMKCWIGKLDDKDAMVRERAAVELGHMSKGAEAVEPLMKHLKEANLDARLAIIQSLDWILDDKSASAKAKTMSADLDKQLEEEKGKTDFVRVNEDLRRLAVKVKRG